MVESGQSLHHSAAAPPGDRAVVVWSLAAGHVAFGAICSPEGLRSGERSVAGLPDPDTLVFAAAGAVWV